MTGTAPGGTAQGGTAPGGTAQGGTAPGGSVAGAVPGTPLQPGNRVTGPTASPSPLPGPTVHFGGTAPVSPPTVSASHHSGGGGVPWWVILLITFGVLVLLGALVLIAR